MTPFTFHLFSSIRFFHVPSIYWFFKIFSLFLILSFGSSIQRSNTLYSILLEGPSDCGFSVVFSWQIFWWAPLFFLVQRSRCSKLQWLVRQIPCVSKYVFVFFVVFFDLSIVIGLVFIFSKSEKYSDQAKATRELTLPHFL